MIQTADIMDPVSIAASTASFVSLGLQVCSGLIDYFKAWKSRDGDIEEALKKLTSLSLTLVSLKKILSVVETQVDNASDNFQEVRDKIFSCSADFNTLHSLLIELESISQPAGVFDKIHNVRLRSTAFFNKGTFKRLQSSIKDTKFNLDSAIQMLQL